MLSMTAAPATARARARAELTAEIKATARRQLAEVGAPALSLRAVARELGMASSAVYRYFESRDALLTALIVDAFDAVGQTAEAAIEGLAGDVPARWRPSLPPSAAGPWPTRTTTRSSTAAPCPAMPLPRTRSHRPGASAW